MAVTISKRKPPEMVVAGLDISTKTGFALVGVYDGKPEVIETAVYTAQRHAGNIARGDAIYSQVIAPILTAKPDEIIIEGYGYGNAHTLVTLVEIGTIIRYELHKHGLQYRDIPPTSMKKFVTGKGNAPKDSVMKEVFKRWGYEGTNDECDAVGLAMFGAAMYGHVELPAVNLSAVNDWMKKHEIDCNQLHK